MSRWIKIVCLVFVISLIVGVLGYLLPGYRDYRWMKTSVEKLEGIRKERAEDGLYGTGNPANVHTGVVAGINPIGRGGLWIWGSQGLRYFGSDADSVYSYYSICNLFLQHKGQTTTVTVNDTDRELETNIVRWAGKVRPGDYVQVVLVTPEVGSNVGKLREALAYEAPLFLPIDVEELCGR